MNQNRNAVVAMITVAALLVGFALGRISSGAGRLRQETDTAAVTTTASTAAGKGASSASTDSSGASTASASGDASLSSASGASTEGSSGSSQAWEAASASDSSSSASSAGAGSASSESSSGNSSEGSTSETPGVSKEADLNRSDLVDAAEADYSSASQGSSETHATVTHEAQTDIPTTATTVDTKTIENVTTINEAPLPSGVVSTLYAKTGNRALFQAVVLGDSQFANFTDEHGLGYLLSQKLHANVYNLAIGGKCASVDPEERTKNNTDPSTWEETCGVNMVKAVCGMADASKVFSGFEYQKNVFDSCDFSKTDLFILEFGVNDFLADHQMTNQDDLGSYFTVFGAFETMVLDIRNTYPDAQILICTPTYAQFWQSGTGAFLGDSNIVYNDYGTLFNYAETISHVAGGHHNCTTVNTYENADINAYTASDDLLDGIHMTDAGRVKYVNLLCRVALRAFGYDIGEGVDPDTIDWVSQKPLAN